MEILKQHLLKKNLKAISKNLFSTYFLALKLRKRLTKDQKEDLINSFSKLQNCLQNKNIEEAKSANQELKLKAQKYLVKSPIRRLFDLVIAITIALIFAFIIRQMWFELYEIPTGSMRPTFKEKDKLTVSKLDFGLNVPFSPRHFYFNKNLINRSGIFIFTSENMDVPDSNTTYFYLFPGKKLLVKRLMAKGGDTIYFYGGRMYGIDKDEKDVSYQMNLPILDKIEHIPFIRFEGRTRTFSKSPSGIYNNRVTFYQMGHPILSMETGAQGKVESSLVIPESIRSNKDFQISHYADLWGMKNFAMARLLTFREVRDEQVPDAPLYLELRHDPNTQRALLNFSEEGKLLPSLNIERSIIPLTIDHLQTLFKNLYTSRFEVKNGQLRRYGSSTPFNSKNVMLPKINGVPDGTYEFYYGKGYEVLWGGLIKEIPSDHPLMQFSIDRIALFFNLGMEFNTLFSPSRNTGYFPSRYAYFRDEDLYVMGAKLMDKADPSLMSFVASEKQKAELSASIKPYFPFIDHKAPLKEDGTLDIELIRNYGLHIPENNYLGLGDNHANSGDSRDFGFIPENNIKGAPSIIFWPFGNRFGPLPQPHYAIFVFQRILVWIIAAAIAILWNRHKKKKEAIPLSFDKLYE